MPEKGIRFQRYVKYKAKIGRNFGGGEKRIKFGGKIEDGKAVVLAAKGRATPRVLGLLGASGQAWMVRSLVCGHADRIEDGGGCGKKEMADGQTGKRAKWAGGQGGQTGKGNHEGCPYAPAPGMDSRSESGMTVAGGVLLAHALPFG